MRVLQRRTLTVVRLRELPCDERDIDRSATSSLRESREIGAAFAQTQWPRRLPPGQPRPTCVAMNRKDPEARTVLRSRRSKRPAAPRFLSAQATPVLQTPIEHRARQGPTRIVSIAESHRRPDGGKG